MSLGLKTKTVVILVFSISCVSRGGTRRHVHEEVLTPDERASALQRAHVWAPTRVAAMNLRTGPRGHGAFAPGQTVTCDYVERQLGGTSPKFACALTPDDVVRVRYGGDNGEVYAGVAATRLLWALGFGADALYPVHVVCRGCPAAMAEDGQVPAGAVAIDVAAIERKQSGHEMETREASGWAWPELDRVDPRVGGAPRAHRDALKLLAVLIQHTDSKAEQQRLLCPGEAGHKYDVARCKTPWMVVHDVGQTFGTGNTFNRSAVGSVNLTEWTATPVWKDVNRCVGNLTQSQTGTLINPTISEAGRSFLANLLTALTDRQLRDLFEVARFTARPQADGHATTVDGWVQAFRKKRKEIVAATCPS
jgi:hypothetical protein